MEVDDPIHAAAMGLILDARPLKEDGLSVVHNSKIKILAEALRHPPKLEAPATDQPDEQSLIEKMVRAHHNYSDSSPLWPGDVQMMRKAFAVVRPCLRVPEREAVTQDEIRQAVMASIAKGYLNDFQLDWIVKNLLERFEIRRRGTDE